MPTGIVGKLIVVNIFGMCVLAFKSVKLSFAISKCFLDKNPELGAEEGLGRCQIDFHHFYPNRTAGGRKSSTELLS